MSKIVFFNKYNSKPIEKGTDFTGMEEVCNQQAAEECEINNLLHQFEVGDISQLPVVREAVYNDIMINPQTFAEAKAYIKKVEDDFFSLPKETQRKFGDIKTYVNDISKMALGDPATLQKYNNLEVSSPQGFADVNSTSSPGSASLSISRGDSENTSSVVKTPDNQGFAEKGE